MTWLDSTWFLVSAYAVAVILALVLGRSEVVRQRIDHTRDLWPAFWFTTAFLLLAMAVGRASDTADFLADLGRQQARTEGWYEARRSLQTIVIGSIAIVWGVAVIVAIWRVPERRRRYLPTAIAVFTLVCYAGVRLISLHQVDALLYNREIGELRIGAIIELAILGSTLVVASFKLGTPKLLAPTGC